MILRTIFKSARLPVLAQKTTNIRCLSSIKNSPDPPNKLTSNEPEKLKDDEIVELPPEPTDCCMSGCEKCVWIVYADTLTQMYEDGGEKAKEIILTRIQDPTMKVFLKMELMNKK